jgi:hypothetical protein
MSLNHFQGKLWAMREIARLAKAEEDAKRAVKKPAVVVKLQIRKPVQKWASR